MSSPTDPTEDNFDQASSRLSDGLRSCRSVVSNYRALLGDDGANEGAQAGFGESDEDPSISGKWWTH